MREARTNHYAAATASRADAASLQKLVHYGWYVEGFLVADQVTSNGDIYHNYKFNGKPPSSCGKYRGASSWLHSPPLTHPFFPPPCIP